MQLFLKIVIILSFLFGLLVFLGSKSAVHEILAMMSFLIMVLAVGFIFIADKLENNTNEMKQALQNFKDKKQIQEKVQNYNPIKK